MAPSPAEPESPASEIAELERAFHDWADTATPDPASNKETLLTIARRDPDDFQDRQMYLFVDGREWGKIRYGESITRPVCPGRHQVRAYNTLFSKTLQLKVQPTEHVRLRCANGFPKAGWLMFVFLHVTYLFVRLERDASTHDQDDGPIDHHA